MTTASAKPSRTRPMQSDPAQCSCCDGTEFLQPSHGTGGLNDVCRPCFNIWYDCEVQCRRDECAGKKPHIHGEDVGAYNQKARAEGTYPFQPGGQFAHLTKDSDNA